MTLLAIALAAPDTDTALKIMARAVGPADLVELRLDLMAEFDLARLVEERPLPVIVTCRPFREGGSWTGSETARLQVLRQAAELGADYVDLEWDVANLASSLARNRTRLILSRHDFQGMPKNWASQAQALWQSGADVVKLVGTAQRLADTVPVLDCLRNAPGPTIAIAMGPWGLPTRVLAFRYHQAFLSFSAPGPSTLAGSVSPTTIPHGQEAAAGQGVKREPLPTTAPGQISAQAMHDVYRVRAITADTAIVALVAEGAEALPMLAEGNAWLAARGLDAVLIPLPLGPGEEEAKAMAALRQVLPLAGWLTTSPRDARLRAVGQSGLEGPRQETDDVIQGLSWILREDERTGHT